jgi:hypothetical protein
LVCTVFNCTCKASSSAKMEWEMLSPRKMTTLTFYPRSEALYEYFNYVHVKSKKRLRLTSFPTLTSSKELLNDLTAIP